MKNIVLLLSTTRQSPKTVDIAVEKAKTENASLTALFVLDSELSDSIFDKLTDIGFTGEKPSQQLQVAILIEYRERATGRLEEIEAHAKSKDVSFNWVMKEGEFTSECLKFIEEKKADLIIITRKKRSSLSRFIFGSPLEAIRKNSSCEMLIVEE